MGCGKLVMGLGIWGLGSGISGSEFGVECLRSRDSSLGYRA